MTNKQYLSAREREILDQMIDYQRKHAEMCLHMANERMAKKQRAWDLERVALLEKLKGWHV